MAELSCGKLGSMVDGRLGLIETAYRLDLDSVGWLQALLDELSRTFEPRRPLLALLSRLEANGSIAYEALATYRDSVSALSPLFEAARISTTAEDHQRMFYGPPERHSLTSMVSRRLHGAATAHGVKEGVGLNCASGDSRAIAIVAVYPEPYYPDARERTFWRPVARHLAAALRLRGTVAREMPEAVLRPDGTIADASGDARASSLRERLRHAVLYRERRRSSRSREGEPFWPELVAGRWTLIDRFESDGRRYVLAVRNGPDGPRLRALTTREQAVIAGIVRGDANKAIALDLGVSESTVSRAARTAMAKLGANLATLGQLARASRHTQRFGPIHVALAALSPAARDTVIDMTRLSRAEREVVQLALRGRTNADIALSRRRSIRTVINQLSAAYDKLGVQSRRELALRLAPAQGPP